MYKVEKDVPIPENVSRGSKSKYPWDEMEVGDSFFVADADKRKKKSISATISQHRKLNKNFGRFVTRSIDGGLRVWRVE